MMKLSTFKPLLGSSIKKDRNKIEPGREWYKTKRWRELRWEVLVRDRFTCQYKGCGKLEVDSSKLIAHHKIPHKGNSKLFFDKENLQTVCKDCHDGPISSEERKNFIWGNWD